MDIDVKIIKKLEPLSGTSAKGEWKRQDVVFETLEQYPKMLCIAFWGDKANDIIKHNDGESLKIFFNLESREYNGRYYTDVRAWGISTKLGLTNNTSAAAGNQTQSTTTESSNNNTSNQVEENLPDFSNTGDDSDDLPF